MVKINLFLFCLFVIIFIPLVSAQDFNFQEDMQNNIREIPYEACEYYRGYYDMSADMGTLLIKLGLLFVCLEFIHSFSKFIFDYLMEKRIEKKTEVI